MLGPLGIKLKWCLQCLERTYKAYTLLTGYRESEDRQDRQTLPRCQNPKCNRSQVLKTFLRLIFHLFHVSVILQLKLKPDSLLYFVKRNL